jgi:hypothetical protein
MGDRTLPYQYMKRHKPVRGQRVEEERHARARAEPSIASPELRPCVLEMMLEVLIVRSLLLLLRQSL